MDTTLDMPVPMRVLERRQNGGGLVQIPLLRAGTINRARTASGGDGALAITRKDLADIVRNFPLFGRPVVIGFGEHKSFGERAGEHPASVRSVMVRDDLLYGDIDLNPDAFDAVVVKEGYKGFSVEMAKDRETPTGTVDGWSLHGGLFTNRPASPVHFTPPLEEMAASMVLSLTIARSPEGRETESEMAQEASLEALQAEAKAKDEKIANLEESLKSAAQARDTATEELAKLTEKVGKLEDAANAAQAVSKAKANTAAELEQRVNKQQEQIANLTAEVEKSKKNELGREVRDLVLSAIREGVEPSAFDGYKDDPAAWLTANFGSVDVLKNVIGRLPKDEKLKQRALSSGADIDTDDSVRLSDDEREILNRQGLDGTFAGVMTEEEARKRLAEKKAREQKG